jgi:hypothetical protein
VSKNNSQVGTKNKVGKPMMPNNMEEQGGTTETMAEQPTGGAATGTTSSSSSAEKCCYRSCRCKGAQKLTCAASNCEKEVHLVCYQAFLLRKHDLEPLAAGAAVCTKKCYDRFLKDNSGKDDEGGRNGNWYNDGKNGPQDPMTSSKILIDWWMTQGN